MSDAPELPPLPDPEPTSHPDGECVDWMFTDEQMHAYGRTCQTPLLAEIERLRHERTEALQLAKHIQLERDDLRAQLEAARKDARTQALIDAARLVELIGADWRDAGVQQKQYAAEYLRDQILDIDAARAEKSGGKDPLRGTPSGDFPEGES